MARLPRVSIGLLMAVVFLIAADFAVAQALWKSAFVGAAIVTLPMINVLLLAIPRFRSVAPVACYWYGFEMAGGLMVLLVGLLACLAQDSFLPIELTQTHLMPTNGIGTPLIISIAIALYTTPQLLVALLFGWLSARYRVAILRR